MSNTERGFLIVAVAFVSGPFLAARYVLIPIVNLFADWLERRWPWPR